MAWCAMTSRIRIAIALADDAFGRSDDILDACRALGFESDAALTGVGIYTGSIELERVASLRTIAGVAAVELERQTQIHSLRTPLPSARGAWVSTIMNPGRWRCVIAVIESQTARGSVLRSPPSRP